MSDGSDIGFGIFLKTKMGERQRAGEMREVLPSQRYNAHLVPEDGSLTCSDPGICESLKAPALASACEVPLSPWISAHRRLALEGECHQFHPLLLGWRGERAGSR